MSPLVLLPALDVTGGRVAQLPPGDARAARPLIVLDRLLDAGSGWVHLVDLDRARGGTPDPALLEELVGRARAAGVDVQLSGGLADEESLTWALGTDATRVCLSPLALTRGDLVADALLEHRDRLCVGLDVSDGVVVARGSQTVLGPLPTWLERVGDLDPLALLVADAARDGSRRGVDLGLFTRVARTRPPGLRTLVASGGVRDATDLRALRAVAGVDAVVLGASVHTGGLDLARELRGSGAR